MKLGNYTFKFKHIKAEKITVVTVLDELGNKIAEAAKVAPKNKEYNKDLARRAVLTKVLGTILVDTETQALGSTEVVTTTTPLFSREERTIIWNDYNNRMFPSGVATITIKEGRSTVVLKIDNREEAQGYCKVSVDLNQFKDAGVPTLQGSIYAGIMKNLGHEVVNEL